MPPRIALAPPPPAPLPTHPEQPSAFPPAAGRARSLALRSDATVCVAGSAYARPLLHVVTGDGRVSAVLDAGCAVARLTGAADAVPGGDGPGPSDGVPGMLVVTDVCPVAVQDRVRGTLWVTGQLRAVPAAERTARTVELSAITPAGCLLDVGGPLMLVDLHVTDIILADSAGIEAVPVDAFRRASPDPLHRDEAVALRQIDESQQDLLVALAARAGMPADRGGVRPLALDAHGVTVRVCRGRRTRDLRIAFARPVGDRSGLTLALQELRRTTVSGADGAA